jgi:hypothetical protein
MRQTLRVNDDMPFNPGQFFSCVIFFRSRRIGILDALCVNDTECCFVCAYTLGVQHRHHFFLRPQRALLQRPRTLLTIGRSTNGQSPI